MPIYVISTIKQKNAAIFPLIDDADLLGGFRTVPLQANLIDATIPASYRKEGMFVWTSDTDKLWRLAADLTTWIEITFGGGSGNSLIDPQLSAESISTGDPVSISAAGGMIKSDAAGTADRREVYGLAASSVVGVAPLDVVTSGVLAYPIGGLTVGSVLYLAVGGGFTTVAPSGAGQSVVRIGQARTAGSIHVRIQVIANL